MSILGDVLKELFKMFVADFRLTLAILAGVTGVAILLDLAVLGPVGGGVVLTILCIAVLAGAVLSETRRRR